jgi:hypothetical protein
MAATQAGAAGQAQDKDQSEPQTHVTGSRHVTGLRPQQHKARWASSISGFYFPGAGFPFASIGGDFSTTLRLGGKPIAANPKYVMRYPLACAGLILTFFLFFYVRRSRSARFLVATTLTILAITFAPGPSAITSKILTWKMVYRLSWMLPWGLTLGFFAARLQMGRLTRRVPAWVPGAGLVVLVALALAGGSPANYVRDLSQRKPLERPQPPAVDALRFLGTEPAPQGVVLASQGMADMIPAYLADAYPAAYRESGIVSTERLEALLASSTVTDAMLDEIRQARCRYILLETTLPLASALSHAGRDRSGLPLSTPDRAGPPFALIYDSQQYRIWKIAAVGRTAR